MTEHDIRRLIDSNYRLMILQLVIGLIGHLTIGGMFLYIFANYIIGSLKVCVTP